MKLLPVCLLFGFSLHFLAPHASAQLADTSRWKINLGPEMPGALGNAENGTADGGEYVGIDYDFANGGAYVALVNDSPIADPFKELRFQIFLDSPHVIAVRVIDAEGEVAQYTLENVSPGEWTDERVLLSDPPTTRFMSSETAGNNEIDFPITSVWLIIQNSSPLQLQGKVKFRNIEVK